MKERYTKFYFDKLSVAVQSYRNAFIIQQSMCVANVLICLYLPRFSLLLMLHYHTGSLEVIFQGLEFCCFRLFLFLFEIIGSSILGHGFIILNHG